MLTDSDMPDGYSLTVSTADELEICDAKNPELGIGAVLQSGDVTFEIRTVDKISGDRETVRGSVLFDMMMRQFGIRVLSITGIWYDGTNLDDLNRLSGSGLNLQEAAAQTWTGRQAARHGFTAVKLLEKIGSRAGMYPMAKFQFTRPATEAI